MPAWDPDAGRLAIHACSADLEKNLATAEHDIDDYVAGSAHARLPRIEIASGNPWPESMAGSERGLGMAVVRMREQAPSDPGLKRFEALSAEVVALQDASPRLGALPGCARRRVDLSL